MSHESVSSYVLSKCVLCPMKECLVMSHEGVSCRQHLEHRIECPVGSQCLGAHKGVERQHWGGGLTTVAMIHIYAVTRRGG